MGRLIGRVFGLIGGASCAACVIAQPCVTWGPVMGLPGVDGQILGLQHFDFDGEGPEPESIIVYGDLRAAGEQRVSNLARWNGTEWLSVGGGSPTRVRSSTVHDIDGDGTQPPVLLFATQRTSSTPSQPADILCWCGETLATFASAPFSSGCNLLASFDEDSDGPEAPSLFACAGDRVYRFDDGEWTLIIEVPAISGEFTAATLFDADDDGPAQPTLVLGGAFNVGAVTHHAPGIWEWTGEEWRTLLGASIQCLVHDLAVFDFDGPGSDAAELVVAAREDVVGLPARVASWNGTRWQALGAGLSGEIRALHAYDEDAEGPLDAHLVAAGDDGVWRWNGSAWEPITVSGPEDVKCLNSARGPDQKRKLVAAGQFESAGDVSVAHVADFADNQWHALGEGATEAFTHLAQQDPDADGPGVPVIVGVTPAPTQLHPDRHVLWARVSGEWSQEAWLNAPVNAITPWSPGGGNAEFLAAGAFTALNGAACGPIVRRSAAGEWTPVDVGADGPVTALLRVPASNGAPDLVIVGGEFQSIGGVAATHVAAWDGANWSPLGPGLNAPVSALALADVDGEGGQPARVFAAGSFTASGGDPMRCVAMWNGSAWVGVGDSLLLEQPSASAPVVSMVEYDPDGSGPQPPVLAVAGPFGPTTTGARYIGAAFWNGSDWHAFGAGVDGEPRSLTTHDWDGRGPKRPRLLVGGWIGTKGVQLNGVGEWTGDEWTGLLPEWFSVRSMLSFDATGQRGSGDSLLVSHDTFLPSLPESSWSPFAIETHSRLPVITSQPEDFTGYVGEQIALNVIYTSDVLVSERWRQNGVPSSESWATDSTPTFAADVRHTGDWELAIVHPCGTIYSRKARITVTPRPVGCPGDANQDGFIGGSDLSVLLGQFGTAVAPGSGADFNDDGRVDGRDLSTLLAGFGSEC